MSLAHTISTKSALMQVSPLAFAAVDIKKCVFKLYYFCIISLNKTIFSLMSGD